ncbi:MAG: aldehyde dehydrogenase family protein [Acidobacteriota bacterium]
MGFFEASVEVKPGRLLIGGKWGDAASGKTIDVMNPSTAEVLTRVAAGDSEDVDRAVAAARKAFDEGPWPRMNANDRQRILWKVAELLTKHRDELAELETLNNGKPIFESKYVDIPGVIDCFEYYSGWATKVHGETIPVKGPYLNYTLREPVGVVGQIIPWNFPLLLASWKVAPALAMGNTVILKPAEQTPLTALRLGELALEAGLPEGVLNIVTGLGPTAGASLVRHAGVDKISFTGDYRTGQEIMRNAAATLKRVSLELGGKSPNIVFADADLEAAARGAINGIFFNKGEVCCAGSRLFVEESVHEALLEKILKRVEKLQPGDPLNPKTRLGPVVSQEQMDKVMGYIESGKSEGAQLRAGGAAGQVTGKPGYFVQPTVFDNVEDSMKIAREEIFGPVLSVARFSDLKSAVARSNASFYGLAAGVWTRDIKKAHQTAKLLRAGTVWINTYNILDSASPFGGYKMSGFGRDLGVHALEQYTNIKSVWVDLSE